MRAAARSILKIDVEGWEPAVVLGAIGWLDQHPKGVILEAHGFDERSPVPWSRATEALLARGTSSSGRISQGESSAGSLTRPPCLRSGTTSPYARPARPGGARREGRGVTGGSGSPGS